MCSGLEGGKEFTDGKYLSEENLRELPSVLEYRCKFPFHRHQQKNPAFSLQIESNHFNFNYFCRLASWLENCVLEHKIRRFSTEYGITVILMAAFATVDGRFHQKTSPQRLYSEQATGL
jgi:hypothetical protein